MTQQETAYQDLEAQRQMARYAFGAVLLTAIGVFLLYRTLRETENVTAETRRIGEAQTRAYLSVVQGRYAAHNDDRSSISVRIFIENTGSSPARNITLTGKLYISNFDKIGAPISPFRINVQPLDIREIGAGRVSENELIITDHARRITHVIGYRNAVIVFRGEIAYRDVFRADDSTQFALFGQHRRGLLKLNEAGTWILGLRPIHPENWDEENQNLDGG